MADLNAQINEARQHGYSDDDILSYLGQSRADLVPKIKEAQSHGYAASDIVGYLGGSAPSQPSHVAKAAGAFWEGIGGKAALDILGGASRDPARAQKAADTVKALVSGIAAEPGRVWDELSNTGQAMLKGDLSGTAYHLAGSVPVFGAPAQQVANEVQQGKYAEAAGHTAALFAPFAAHEVGRVAAPVVSPVIDRTTAAIAENAPKAAAALRGGTVSAAKEAAQKPPWGATLMGEAVGGHKGAAAAAILAKTPAVVRAFKAGAAEALDALEAQRAPTLPPDVTTTVTPPPAVDIPAAAPPPAAGSLPGQFPARTTPGTLTSTIAPPPAAPMRPGTIPPVSGGFPGQGIVSTVGRVAPVAESPGMALARASGQDWAKLSVGDQAILEQIAQAQSNLGERMAPPRATPPDPRPIVETPAAPPGKTLAEQIAEDVAARKAAAAPPATMPPESATMAPAQAEAVFQQQKARIREGMTPPPEQPPPAPAGAGGPTLLPMPEDVPPHYQALQQLEGTSAATRTYLKDRRIADYLLKKGVTPEQFEAMPFEDQNRLIVEAPSASARGKHRPFLRKPEGAAPRAVGRWAEEGIKDIADTMRWMQEQTRAAAQR